MKNHHVYSISFFIALVFIFPAWKESGGDDENKNKTLFSAYRVNKNHFALTNAYSSDLVLQWMDLQLELIRTSSPFIGGLPPSRPFAYAGIALYEAVVPGMPAYRSLSGQLTDMPAMPKIFPGNSYHWPTCANAALAAINRNFFPNTSDANKAAMNSLEEKLNAIYKTEAGDEVFQCSVKFGKEVAQLIFNWSQTDGCDKANSKYSPPVGSGFWAPTPPSFAAAFWPYWGNNRLLVPGSLDNTEPPTPPEYSIDPSSDYFKMAKEV